MVLPGSSGREHDSRQISLGDHDLLVLRGDFPEGYATRLQTAIQQKNPNWDGMMICLRVDQELSQMPEHVARELYQGLHKVFGASSKKKGRPNSRKKRQMQALTDKCG